MEKQIPYKQETEKRECFASYYYEAKWTLRQKLLLEAKETALYKDKMLN